METAHEAVPDDASEPVETGAAVVDETLASPVSRAKRVRAAPDVFAPEVKEKEDFVIRQVGA